MTRENMIRWMAFAEGKTPSQMKFEMSAFDDDTVKQQYKNDREAAAQQIKEQYAATF